MLQSLRDKAQGWIAWLIVGLIALTFILYGSESILSSNGEGKTVAKINGVKITQKQLDMAYKQYLQQAGQSSEVNPDAVKKELLQSLIEDAILNQNALKLGMFLSEKRMEQLIEGIPAFQKDGQYSQELFYQFLSREGYSQNDFLQLLKDALLKQQLQMSILQTAFSVPQDLNSLIKYLLQKRAFGIFIIQRDTFKSNTPINDKEIKAYYDQHKKEFMTDEQVGIEYLLLTKAELMQQFQPTPEQIELFFKENAQAFHEPERRNVAHILISLPQGATAQQKKEAQDKIDLIQAKLKKGETFEALASQFSDDTATKQEGGSLNWIAKGEMIPEFEKSAFSIKNKGEIASAQTQFGLHLIKLNDIQLEKQRPFNEVKDEVIDKMKQQWAEEKIAVMSDELSDLVYDHPDTLQVAADKLSLKVNASEMFTLTDGPKEKILQQPAIVEAISSPTVKEDRNNSELIKLEDGYLVLRLVKHIPAKEKPLADVKNKISEMIANEKAHQLALAEAQKQYNQVLALKNDPEKLKTQFKWDFKKDVTRSTDTVKAPILEALFSLPWPITSQNSPFKMVNLDDGDVAIVWLTDVVNGDKSLVSKQEKENFDAQLSKHTGELEYALYATSLFNQARVKKKTIQEE